MPSKSKSQHRFMEMVAHNPKAAKRVGVAQSVGKEFVSADKGKKFKTGGEMAAKKFDPKKLFKGKESVSEELKEAKAIKAGKISPMQYAKGEESEKKMKCGGSAKMKCGGTPKKFAGGGLGTDARNSADVERTSATRVKPAISKAVDKAPPAARKVTNDMLAGEAVDKYRKGKGFAKGGLTSGRGDGIASKGKTKCKYV